MKFLKYLLVGILFGIVMTKSEAISWFRIQEMFLFQSFHMYGIIGTAVVVGAIMTLILKYYRAKNVKGETMSFTLKAFGINNLIGGIIFGLGWAITGACPGPLFVLAGHGIAMILIIIIAAIFGTFVYGLLKKRLPH